MARLRALRGEWDRLAATDPLPPTLGLGPAGAALEAVWRDEVHATSPRPPQRRARTLQTTVDLVTAWTARAPLVWVDQPSLHALVLRPVAVEARGAALVVTLRGPAGWLELHVTGDLHVEVRGPELRLHGDVEVRRQGAATSSRSFGPLRLVRR